MPPTSSGSPMLCAQRCSLPTSGRTLRSTVKKGRIYVPQQDLVTFGVSEAQIARGEIDQNWQRLMAFEVQRARTLLNQGAPLARTLSGRIGLELRMVVQGGLRILERIDAVGGDVFSASPPAHRTRLDSHELASPYCTRCAALDLRDDARSSTASRKRYPAAPASITRFCSCRRSGAGQSPRFMPTAAKSMTWSMKSATRPPRRPLSPGGAAKSKSCFAGIRRTR